MRRFLATLALWIVGWTLLFSLCDFASIKVFRAYEYTWFQDYRRAMNDQAAWISPLSFALAENVYFVWVNVFDAARTMHEWDFYSGNPLNPDGKGNFVWGDGRGGWYAYPMTRWYEEWLRRAATWLGVVLAVAGSRSLFTRRITPSPIG
ncbi:MAG: hypothetical protein WCF84_02365 [Anaerolineae bacterium]